MSENDKAVTELIHDFLMGFSALDLSSEEIFIALTTLVFFLAGNNPVKAYNICVSLGDFFDTFGNEL